MRSRRFKRIPVPSWLLAMALMLASCAPVIRPPGRALEQPRLTQDAFVSNDGVHLPLRYWLPEEKADIKAVIIALHGFNDYSNFFAEPGRFFAQSGIASYAYDQRGFGAGSYRGLWAGTPAYVRDLYVFTHLIKLQHPGVPVYVLGESMGGAVVIASMTSNLRPPVDGIILSAPAVWGRETMPWYQRALLWVSSHVAPSMKVTGKELGLRPSDNIEMLRALGRDPLVIKETRIDAIYGLTNLMDIALVGSRYLDVSTLMVYGEKDEIIPPKPVRRMLKNLPSDGLQYWHIAFYRNGYHMLLRDLQAQVLWQDIVAWISANDQPLPSGADRRAEYRLTLLRTE